MMRIYHVADVDRDPAIEGIIATPFADFFSLRNVR